MLRCLSFTLLAAALCAPAPAARSAEPEREKTRALMRDMLENLQVLLPASASTQSFADPARADEIRQALQALASNASAIADHAGARDRSSRYLADAVAHDARQVLRAWSQGRTESSIFFLHQTTQNCVACHTRLPHPGDSPFSESLAKSATLAALPALERARIQVATRRFEDALTTYEAIFADASLHPAETLSAWTDYLVVCLRGEGDYVRPQAALERFAKRPDVWSNLRDDVRAWLDSVRELAPRAEQAPSLASARALLDQASLRMRFPADRQALVHYIAASTHLHRFVAAHPEATPETGEAYWLLGLAELHVAREYWVSSADFYLETAIRTAPKAPYAKQAYALLEQETLLGYTGSAGTNLPDDVKRHLAELRKLVESK
jgi:hypothetical protein